MVSWPAGRAQPLITVGVLPTAQAIRLPAKTSKDTNTVLRL